MSDSASGSVDKSVQVKLVLLGKAIILAHILLPRPLVIEKRFLETDVVMPTLIRRSRCRQIICSPSICTFKGLPQLRLFTELFVSWCRCQTNSKPTKSPLLVPLSSLRNVASKTVSYDMRSGTRPVKSGSIHSLCVLLRSFSVITSHCCTAHVLP
jgi:hypothetical protein